MLKFIFKKEQQMIKIAEQCLKIMFLWTAERETMNEVNVLNAAYPTLELPVTAAGY